MVRTWIILVVSALSCFGQGTGFGFKSVAFMGGEVNTNITPPFSNQVAWQPASSTIDWMSATGGTHYAENLAQFVTNDVSDIVRFDAHGSVGNYITNFENLVALTNLRSLRIETCTGMKFLDIDQVGAGVITNIVVSQNPDLIVLSFETSGGHGGQLDYINLSYNPSMTNIQDSGWASFDSQSTTFAINNNSLSNDPDGQITNAACAMLSQIVNNSISNGVFAAEGNAGPIGDSSCPDTMSGYGWTVSY